MLLRDLLATLPGLLTPVGTTSRDGEPLSVDLSAFNLTSQAGVNPFASGAVPQSSDNLRDFYAQHSIDLDNPILPGGLAPLLPETGDSGEEDTGGDDGDTDDGDTGGGDTDDGGTGDGGDTSEPGILLPETSVSLTAEAGRVLTINPSSNEDVSSVRILSQAEHGHVSVNPDFGLTFVASENPGDTDGTGFRYEITYANGDTKEVEIDLDFTESQQQQGWGKGEFYMLEEDRNGSLVIEHGENHRKIYATESDQGLTAAQIAKMEGIDPERVSADWLAKHPEYGATPETALSTELATDLWYKLVKDGPSSNWLLFERGYEYHDTGRLVSASASGESALHPLFIGAYGEGADPIIDTKVEIYQRDSDHVVLQGLDINHFMALQGSNMLLDDMSITRESMNVQSVDRFTLRNSDVFDIFHDEPVNDGDYWQPSPNRTGGAFMSGTTGILIENNVFDHNGWGDGYDYNLSADAPMPPSFYSHNLYLANNNLDVTVRDNILMRAASFGAQVRSGGVIEDNVFIDNNAAVSSLGGDYRGAGPIGNFTLYLDNLVTSAGHKRVAEKEGALSIGVDAWGRQTSLIGNIITHLADPNNPDEIAEKTVAHYALKEGPDIAFNDTIIYNWSSGNKGLEAGSNQNLDGLDASVLDQTTIQNFAAELLGKDSATIGDLGDYLRAQAAGQLDHVVDADLINAYFREGFGLSTTLRAEEAMLRFVPDDRADGIRWDNRLNWDSGDLPGTQDGDSVDLGGNRVMFGAQTVTIDDFIFGDYGQLKATSGRLNIDGGVSVADTGALLQISTAGQVWMAGYLDSDMLNIEITGGRFANTGAFAGAVDLDLSGTGQALLAVAGGSFDLGAGSGIAITGNTARLGFDGGDGGNAVLRMDDEASLAFVADEKGLGKLSEFYSGAYETSDVTSGIRLGGDLTIDLSDWTMDPKAQDWVLLEADQIIGTFEGLKIEGLSTNRDALVRVDYVTDTVTLKLSQNGHGSGQVRMVEAGEADFIDYTKDAALTALWTELHQDAPQISDTPF